MHKDNAQEKPVLSRQKVTWLFCAEAGLGICNGNRIDDWDGCAQHDFRACGKVLAFTAR